MKTFDFEQRSPEWYAIRCGIPTASNFDKIVTTKGEPSKQRLKYLYKLAGESITKAPEDTYQSQAMLRGCEVEKEARMFYEFITGEKADEVGFCMIEGESEYGCSPDALTGGKGLLEIKCPIISTHVGYLIKNTLVTDYFQQCQGQMLVTGREWTDLLSYYPGMKPLIIRINRDEEFIGKLEAELKSFTKELKETIKKIK